MDEYGQLYEARGDGDSSDDSSEQPPSFRVLKEHGYAIKKELGRGDSGGPVLVNNTNGDPYVVKQMIYRDKKQLVKIQKEVEILKTLKHGYIVTYEDSFEDEERFYVVMDYCAGGDLLKRMQTQKGIFEEEQILDWLVQIFLALQYLREKKVLHRDIKPQNIFLTEDGYINLDVGCSKALESADANAESGLYASPEVFLKKYHSKSDIWSLGWLLHDLCMLDVRPNIIERRFLHALSMKENPPQISEMYSKDLRELIKEMLSCDPEHRPSAEEILARPFLSNAVYRNKRIPEALDRRFKKFFKTFDKAYNKHYRDFETLVKEWGETTDSLKQIHYNSTAGALAGSVIGAAGGITALVGAVLAPFTAGASLILTGVGVGVGVAGGITGAAFSINNAVHQKSLRESLEKIQRDFDNASESILNSLITLQIEVRKINKCSDFVINSTFEDVQISGNADKTKIACAAELVNLAQLGNVVRIAGESARVGHLTAAAISGVISGIIAIVDVVFIVNDSREIHQMRQGKIDDPEKVSSSALKSIAEMRKTHAELCKALNVIKETREKAQQYMSGEKD